jgi:glycosyltransferase involved in cell wall biosynthesis
VISAESTQTTQFDSPLVTIAVPSYNQGGFLNDTLESIFKADVPVEVFVMDAGSTDHSVEVIEKWAPKLSGWRSHTDSGQAAAINEGISQGSAPYVCWLNSDDFFYPGGLKSLLSSLVSDPGKAYTYGKCWTVNVSGKKLAPYLTMGFSPRIFANFCFIAQPATLMTRVAWEQAGGLRETMQMAFDYDLWWRLHNTNGAPLYCREFVAATRKHGDTKTANGLDLHYEESMALVKEHWGRIPVKWRIALPFMRAVRKIVG